MKKTYDIGAYVWPAYTGDEPRTLPFWPKGNGEWETVEDAKKLFEGHSWPRKPVWGYVNEADPKVMEMEIEEAKKYGVNVFIYDWYWFDDRPFLEQCLDNGFLQAKNSGDMKFYLMWANHDVTFGWDRRISTENYDTVIWQGAVGKESFETIGKRLVGKYFTRENYYKIDGKPVFSIYDVNNLVKGLGGIKQTKKAMLWLDKLCKKAGLKGIHYQLIKYMGVDTSNLSGFDGSKKSVSAEEIVKLLPFSSLTHYQYAHFMNMGRDYNEIVADFDKEYASVEKNFSIPYFPHVSIGWDNTPRYYTHTNSVTRNNTPENFKKALEKAKAYADEHNVNFISVNSWNEWTETSYLEPDDINGYGYLEAVKSVFKDGE